MPRDRQGEWQFFVARPRAAGTSARPRAAGTSRRSMPPLGDGPLDARVVEFHPAVIAAEPTIDRQTVGNVTVIRICGELNEHLKRDPLIEGLTGAVVFDLNDVHRVTSFGVREWISALRQLEADYYAFVRCHPAILSQFNMVAGFGGIGELVSFYLPYVCPDCDEATEVLVDLRHDYATVVGGEPPPARCPACDAEAEFDDIPDQYFSYVATRPAPVVPSEVRRAIDGGETHRPERLSVEKEVDGLVTMLWLSGPVDERARVKRLFEGLEGYVVLEVSGVTSVTSEGLGKLTAFASDPAIRQVQYARAGSDVLRLLEQRRRQRQPVKGAVSLLLRRSCPECGLEVGTEIFVDDAPRAIEEGHTTGCCLQCGTETSIPFPSDLIEPAQHLLVPTVTDVTAYLRRRPFDPRRHSVGPTGSGTSSVRYQLERLSARKYEPIRRIGVGGMAEVFLARQKGPEGFSRRVVLKRILPALSQDPVFTNMFLQEARLAARISHPNVVHIYDLGRDGDRFFIAMEYIEGWDLQALLREAHNKHVQVPIPVACRIVAQLCAGLHAAHTTTNDDGESVGIVHRDVSPHNVLISRDGGTKITDFGVAKAAHSLVDTRPGAIKGKVAYMAPEQVRGEHDQVGPQADVFAAGNILYQCLIGRLPFRRGSDYETMHAIVNAPLASLRALREDVPDGLNAIVHKALARDLTERYATARALQFDLEELLARRGSTMTTLGVASWTRELMGDRPSDGVFGVPGTDSSVGEDSAPDRTVTVRSSIGIRSEPVPSESSSTIPPGHRKES